MKYTAANTFMYLFILFVFAYGQEKTRLEYQLLLNEAHLFEQLHTTQVQNALVDSAQAYADAGDFELAMLFLEEYISQFKTDTSIKKSSIIQAKTWQWSLHTGLDFNRQEFEVGYIQSDSILREQLNKPYIAAELAKEWRFDRGRFLTAASRLRYDKENLTISLNGAGGIRGKRVNLQLQGVYEMDQNNLYPDFSYQEGRTRQSLLWSPATKMEFQAENDLDYKKYQKPSSAVPSYYHDQFTMALNYRPSFDALWQIDYTLDWNESIHYQNNDYHEQVIALSHNRMLMDICRLQLKSGYDVNRFTYALSDSAISNRYSAIFAELQTRLFINDAVSLNMEYRGKRKRYIYKTEQSPDYYWQQLRSNLKNRLFTNFFLEGGYQYESKKYSVFSGATREYIDEQNYFGHGILFSVEYSNINSYLISLNAVYTWRRYPDANSDNIISLYANRNVLNLNLLAQVPLGKGIFFNLFASYDDDQDLDTEESNTRNSFFSAEFEYRF